MYIVGIEGEYRYITCIDRTVTFVLPHALRQQFTAGLTKITQRVSVQSSHQYTPNNTLESLRSCFNTLFSSHFINYIYNSLSAGVLC